MTGRTITTVAGRQATALTNEQLQLGGSRGAANDRVHVAAVSLISLIDSVYWLSERETARAAPYILEHQGLSNQELADVVRVLANAGYAYRFFKLFRPRNDPGRALRAYAVAHDLTWDLVLQHYEFEVFDGVTLTSGFVFGVGESFAQIALFLRDFFGFFVDDSTNLQQLLDRMRKMMAQLAELDVIGFLGAQWEATQVELTKNFLDLDFFAAGRQLGKIAGDLYQLLGGAVAIAKMIGAAGKAIARLVPLFAKTARSAAISVAELVARIGPQIILGAQRIGAATLALMTNLKRLFAWMKSSVTAFFDGMGNVFLKLEGNEFAMAGGLPMPTRAILVGREGMGWKTFVLNMTAEEGTKLYDAVVDALEQRFFGGKPPKVPAKLPDPKSVERVAADLEKISAGIVRVRELTDLANKVRAELLAAIEAAGKVGVDAKTFGTQLHARIRKLIDATASALKAQGITVRTEATFATLAAELGGDASLMDKPLIKWILSRPDLMKLLPGDAKTIEAMLLEMGYTAETKIGALRCDAVYLRGAGLGAEGAIIDWTSNNALERLGERLAELRLKMNGQLTPAAVDGLLRYHGTHTLFTMNVRMFIMQSILPEVAWSATDVLYQAVGATLKAVK